MGDDVISKEELIDLSKRWRLGDKEAFSVIYDAYVDKIYKFIYFKVDSADAEDITELTFIKAWEKRKKYDPKKSSFSSWLYTIARNTVIDHYRVSKPVAELDPTLSDDKRISNPKDRTEQSLNADFLREAVSELPKNYRDIILLRFIDDLSYSEIAKILDKSEGSIRIMQFRAIRQLRDILKKSGFDSNNLSF